MASLGSSVGHGSEKFRVTESGADLHIQFKKAGTWGKKYKISILKSGRPVEMQTRSAESLKKLGERVMKLYMKMGFENKIKEDDLDKTSIQNRFSSTDPSKNSALISKQNGAVIKKLKSSDPEFNTTNSIFNEIFGSCTERTPSTGSGMGRGAGAGAGARVDTPSPGGGASPGTPEAADATPEAAAVAPGSTPIPAGRDDRIVEENTRLGRGAATTPDTPDALAPHRAAAAGRTVATPGLLGTSPWATTPAAPHHAAADAATPESPAAGDGNDSDSVSGDEIDGRDNAATPGASLSMTATNPAAADDGIGSGAGVGGSVDDVGAARPPINDMRTDPVNPTPATTPELVDTAETPTEIPTEGMDMGRAAINSAISEASALDAVATAAQARAALDRIANTNAAREAASEDDLEVVNAIANTLAAETEAATRINAAMNADAAFEDALEDAELAAAAAADSLFRPPSPPTSPPPLRRTVFPRPAPPATPHPTHNLRSAALELSDDDDQSDIVVHDTPTISYRMDGANDNDCQNARAAAKDALTSAGIDPSHFITTMVNGLVDRVAPPNSEDGSISVIDIASNYDMTIDDVTESIEKVSSGIISVIFAKNTHVKTSPNVIANRITDAIRTCIEGLSLQMIQAFAGDKELMLAAIAQIRRDSDADFADLIFAASRLVIAIANEEARSCF